MTKRQILLLTAALSALVASAAFSSSVRTVSAASATPTPTPVSMRTPTPAPSPTPAIQPTQTLADLQTKIRSRILVPEVARGRVGIKIISLNSGKVIFENDAEKYFMPASNMKNFTVATAMEKLTPDYRFVTSVFAKAMPDETGTVSGDLRIYGRGDVSISTAFFGTDPSDPATYYKGIDRLVDEIARAGVKKINGSLIGDESYFKGDPIPYGWEWDDLQWYYGSEVSAFPINDSAVDITVKPGDAGGPCLVTLLPPNPVYSINNSCTTGGTGQTPRVTKRLDRNVLDISGMMSRDSRTIAGSIAVSHPADLFLAMLKERLQARGITVAGGTRTLPPNIASPIGEIEIAKLESPPFALIAAKTLKPSQNLYTETILWTLGENRRMTTPGTSGDSSQIGLGVVKSFLSSIGIPADGIVQYDGSGLSRHDLITPSAVVTLYTYMAKQSRFAQAWRDSLTIAGVDGTLQRRFVGTRAAGNMRGKTGTIDQVSALSGYVNTAAGEPVVLSIVVNDVPTPSQRTRLIDDIVVSIANFDGKLDQADSPKP